MIYTSSFVRLDVIRREFDVLKQGDDYSNVYVYVNEHGVPVTYEKDPKRLTIFYNRDASPVNSESFDVSCMSKMSSSGYIAHSLDVPAIFDETYYILGEEVNESEWRGNRLSLLYKLTGLGIKRKNKNKVYSFLIKDIYY